MSASRNGNPDSRTAWRTAETMASGGSVVRMASDDTSDQEDWYSVGNGGVSRLECRTSATTPTMVDQNGPGVPRCTWPPNAFLPGKYTLAKVSFTTIARGTGVG